MKARSRVPWRSFSRRAFSRALLSLSLLAAALAAGCSSSPPVISRVLGRIVYVQDLKTGGMSETLGVFLVATDPDGLENLSAFYVINDDAELFWKAERASWSTAVAEGETWIGISSLVMPGGAPFPVGTYRVVLQSAGGDTVEDTITVPPREIPASKASYPSVSVVNDIIRVKSPSATFEVWIYGKDGSLSGVFPMESKAPALQVATVTAASPALAGGFTFRIYSSDPQAGYSVLAGPWSVGE